MFDKFRHLLQYGEPDEFFSFANDYERVLHDKGYMMLYYKLLNNEGFLRCDITWYLGPCRPASVSTKNSITTVQANITTSQRA